MKRFTPGSAFTPSGKRHSGWRPPTSSPMITVPGAIKIILGVMILVQVALTVLPSAQANWIVNTFGLALFWRGEFLTERLYTLLSYAFLHGGWLHLLFNGLWIATLGSQVYRFLELDRFLILFAVCSVAGGLAQALGHWGELTLTVGASSAVFGLIGAAGHIWVAAPHMDGLTRLKKLFGFAMIMMVLNLGYAYLGAPGDGGGTISWEAHAGGFFAGLLLFPLLLPRPRRSV